MAEPTQKKCNHLQKDKCELTKNLSYCYQCSSLILVNETQSVISTVKPNDRYQIQETTPLFLSLIDEHRPRNFINKIEYIKLRTFIIKQMKNFCEFFKLAKKTYFLSLDYFDRICSNMIQFNLNALIQISYFCILLACKYQENGG